MARLDRIDLLRLRLVEDLEGRPACPKKDDAAVFAAPVGQLLEPDRISIERHSLIEVRDGEGYPQLGYFSHRMLKRSAARVTFPSAAPVYGAGMGEDQPPICPACGVTMVPAELSARSDVVGEWVCLECEELGEDA
jgi:hypothetical protein